MSPRATSGEYSTGAFIVAQLARAEPADGALARATADALRRFQLAPVAQRAVPVVTLHLLAFAAEHRAADAVHRAWIRRQEAERIAICTQAAMRADRGAFGVRDALGVDRHRRGFARDRHVAGALRRDLPGVRQVELGHVPRKVCRVGQSRARILGRVFRDRAGLGHGLAQRGGTEVAGARAALAGAEVHGDAHAAIALVLDRLDFTEARTDAQAHVHADGRFGLARTEAACLGQRELDEREQVGAVGGQHGGMVLGGDSRAHRAAASVIGACWQACDSSSGPGLRPAC